MSNSVSYFNKVSTQYFNKSHKGLWRLVRKAEMRSVLNVLCPSVGDQILEIGAGAGFYSSYLKNNLLIDVLAIEESEGMAQQLESKGISYIQGKFEEQRLEEQYAKILCAGVLEFVDNPEIFLSRCKKNLRKNGILVLLVPSGGILNFFYCLFHLFSGCPTHRRNPSEYIEIATKLGFVVDDIKRGSFFSKVIKLSLS